MYKITKILLEKTTKSFSKVWPQKAVYYEVDGGVEHQQIPHHTVQQPPKQTGITTQPFRAGNEPSQIFQVPGKDPY